MKQYVVDELRPGDYEALKTYLDEHLDYAGLDGLYWKPIENDLLTDAQVAHTRCAPFFITLTLTPESLTCELLVRTRNSVRCDCIAYATVTQRNWIISWTDSVIEKLGIVA